MTDEESERLTETGFPEVESRKYKYSSTKISELSKFSTNQPRCPFGVCTFGAFGISSLKTVLMQGYLDGVKPILFLLGLIRNNYRVLQSVTEYSTLQSFLYKLLHMLFL